RDGSWHGWMTLACGVGTTATTLRTVSHATTLPTTHKPAQMRIAAATRSVNTAGASVVSRWTTAGSTATESRPARRAAALLTPDAMPISSASTAANTAAVSGATVSERPSPNTIAAGSTEVR